MMYKTQMESPIGLLWIVADEQAILRIEFAKDLSNEPRMERTALLDRCVRQLDAYFLGKRHLFDIPVSITGTPFQQRVYTRLISIPYGQTRSYKEIALEVGSPKGMRAVGGANNKNSIPILIPCHRVIGADGNLVGYAGGLAIKSWLLEHERKHCIGS